MHTPDPGGVAVAIAGVDKAREAEVLMLEELEHQAADTENKKVGKHCGRQVGKKEETCCILDTCYREGEKCWMSWPPLRETITHGRMSVWMRKGSNNTIMAWDAPSVLAPPGLGRLCKKV